MNIAISQRNDRNEYGDFVDSLENNYANYFEKFGIRLIVIPNSTKNIAKYFEDFSISAVILSGGNTINLKLYGGEIEEGLAVSDERDETERELLEIAIKNKLPVLGICRGMQFINVFFKGKLINIEREIENKVEHVRKDHNVKILNEGAIKLFGGEVQVNSYHNQGINLDTLSSELQMFAQADDGIIEGIYHPSLPIAGIQWHPERKSPDDGANKKIMKAFLDGELFWKLKSR